MKQRVPLKRSSLSLPLHEINYVHIIWLRIWSMPLPLLHNVIWVTYCSNSLCLDLTNKELRCTSSPVARYTSRCRLVHAHILSVKWRLNTSASWWLCVGLSHVLLRWSQSCAWPPIHVTSVGQSRTNLWVNTYWEIFILFKNAFALAEVLSLQFYCYVLGCDLIFVDVM